MTVQSVTTFELSGKAIELIDVGGGRHAVQIESHRRMIRARITRCAVSESGHVHTYGEPRWIEGETADLAPLLECLTADAKRTSSAQGLVLEHRVQWGHFRQNRRTKVSISMASDGAIEIDMMVSTQDESYY